MTKQNISESNKIYHQLFTNSPNSIVLMNLEGKIVDCNLSQEKIFGYKKDELIGKDFRELNVFTDEYLPIAIKHFENILKGINPNPKEVQIYKKDGNLKWVLLQANLIKINKLPIIQTIAQDITAIKEAEQKLKLSEKKYERIIKHLDIGYFKIDENGIIIDYNPAFGKIFGFQKDENLIGVSAIDLWENPEEFKEYREELVEKRKLRNYIHKARKKNGERIILHTHSHLYKNKEKNRYEAEGTIFDITEKFELEQKLKESEKNYRNIIENAQDAIVIFGLDGKLKYISPQLTNMLGREIKLGTRAFDGVHPEDEKKLVEAFKRAVKEKGTFTNEEFDFRAVHNDGHYIWLSSLTKNYYDDEGNLVGFIALLKDITEKKEAQRKLMESEQKYKSIIENSKDAVVLVGLDGNFKYVSPQLSSILGREVNLQTQLFRNIHPEDLNNLMDLFSTAVRKKEVILNQEVEFRTLHNNGHYIWLSSSSKTYHDENGNVIGFITLLRDITEKKEAEQKLMDYEKKYKEILNNIEQGFYEVDLKGNY
ncbi:MAG: PAS domain-containing protein, partial [Promethearchaeota archaeon]